MIKKNLLKRFKNKVKGILGVNVTIKQLVLTFIISCILLTTLGWMFIFKGNGVFVRLLSFHTWFIIYLGIAAPFFVVFVLILHSKRQLMFKTLLITLIIAVSLPVFLIGLYSVSNLIIRFPLLLPFAYLSVGGVIAMKYLDT